MRNNTPIRETTTHSAAAETSGAWETAERKMYTASEARLIHEAGLQDGMSAVMEALQETVAARIDALAESRDRVAAKLRDLGLHPIAAYLGNSSVAKFGMLIFVPVKEFHTEKFSEIYSLTRDIADQVNNEKNICLRISFAGAREAIDHNQVLSDGYTHFYDFKAETETRVAQ